MISHTRAVRIFIYLFIIAFFTLPASAQVTDDMPTDTIATGVYCPKIIHTMQKYSCDSGLASGYCKAFVTGAQVTELQLFLTDYFDLDETQTVTGLFGKTTQKYLMRFQQQNGLPAFGIAGTLTRAKIASVCGGAGSPLSSGHDTRPVAEAPSIDIKVNGSDGPMPMPSNNMATVSWATKGVTDCDIANAQVVRTGAQELGSKGYLPPSGAQYVFLNGGSVVLTCYNRGQKVEDSVSIANPTAVRGIQVASPNGDETFTKGAPFATRMTVNGQYPAGTKVCINLINQATQASYVPYYGGTGTEFCALIDTAKNTQDIVLSGVLAAGNSYDYLLPGSYKVRVFTVFEPGAYKPEFDMFDESDGAFTVVNQSAGTVVPVITTFTSSLDTVPYLQSVRVTVSASNAVRCAMTSYDPVTNTKVKDFDPFLEMPGTAIVSGWYDFIPAKTLKYILHCDGASGKSAEASLTVPVTEQTAQSAFVSVPARTYGAIDTLSTDFTAPVTGLASVNVSTDTVLSGIRPWIGFSNCPTCGTASLTQTFLFPRVSPGQTVTLTAVPRFAAANTTFTARATGGVVTSGATHTFTQGTTKDPWIITVVGGSAGGDVQVVIGNGATSGAQYVYMDSYSTAAYKATQ